MVHTGQKKHEIPKVVNITEFNVNKVINIDVIHLTMWYGVNPPSNREVLQKLVDKFNDSHPDIYVEPLYFGEQDQQIPKILAAVADLFRNLWAISRQSKFF